MKKNSDAIYEIILAVLIIALMLLPQLIGTTSVADETAGVDENGCPVTSKTLTDLEAPGTRFGTLTIHEWESEIRNCGRSKKTLRMQWRNISRNPLQSAVFGIPAEMRKQQKKSSFSWST